MGYITLIKTEREDSYKIGFGETNDINEHIRFKKEMMECCNVDSVRLLEVKEIKEDGDIKYPEFTKNDWNHFHDVVMSATYKTKKINLNQREMNNLFSKLPNELKLEAFEFGMSDTLWREHFFDWYINNHIN